MTFIQVWDAGHSFSTPGKRSPNGMKEYEFNRAVATYCKEFTDSEYIGIQSVFTHSDNRDVPLGERTAHANRIGADCFTSIHANANGSGSWDSANGIEVFVYKTRPIKAYALALQVQRDLIAATGLNDRGVKTADFAVLRETKMTAILAECGFMTNQKEAALLKSDEYRRKVARALVKAHAAFFGWQKVKKESAPVESISEWAKEAVEWAKANGITDGSGMKAAPTKEEVITLIYRVCNFKGEKL